MPSEYEIDDDIAALLEEESRRLGGRVTTDELAVIAQHVLDAKYRKYRESQEQGIRGAREKGVRFGRPPIPKPKEWPRVYEGYMKGILTLSSCSKILGVSTATVSRWALEEEREIARQETEA